MIITATLLSRWERYSSTLLGLILATLVCSEITQVLLRHAFSLSIVWVDDIRALLLLWLGWQGAAHLWMNQSHLIVDFFGNGSGVYSQRLNVLCDFLVIIGVIWLMPAFLDAMSIYNSMVMPMLALPQGFKFIPPIAALSQIALFACLRLLQLFKARLSGVCSP